MKNTLDAEMRAATQLTRAGRLGDAVGVLQRVLGGHAGATDTDAAKTIDGEVEHPQAKPQLVGRLLAGLEKLLSPRVHPRSDGPPSPSARDATFTSGIFADAAGSRPYKLFVPAGIGPGRPLVVMLHGCTQSPDDFAAGTRMNELAAAHGFLVVYPEQVALANTQRCWNWFGPDNQRRDHGEAGLIAGITREVMHEHRVDPARVYVAGLSAGGATAATMGMVYPDLYAAVGVHSGLASGAANDMPSAFAAMRGGASGGSMKSGGSRTTPTIVFHGDRDGTVNPRNGDSVAAQVISGRDLRTEVQNGQVPGGHAYTRTIRCKPDGKAVLEQWVIHGADHAWSGGSRDGSFTDPLGPDASKEMLRFFLSHRLQTATG